MSEWKVNLRPYKLRPPESLEDRRTLSAIPAVVAMANIAPLDLDIANTPFVAHLPSNVESANISSRALILSTMNGRLEPQSSCRILPIGATHALTEEHGRPGGEGFWDCVRRSLADNGIYLAVGDAILLGICIAGCTGVTGGVGVVPCIRGCVTAIVGGNAVGLIIACWNSSNPADPKEPADPPPNNANRLSNTCCSGMVSSATSGAHDLVLNEEYNHAKQNNESSFSADTTTIAFNASDLVPRRFGNAPFGNLAQYRIPQNAGEWNRRGINDSCDCGLDQDVDRDTIGANPMARPLD